RLQPIAPDHLHGALHAAIRPEPKKRLRRVIVALTCAFVERAIGNSSCYLDDRLSGGERTSCLNASPKPCAPQASLAGRMPWGTASSRSCSPERCQTR